MSFNIINPIDRSIAKVVQDKEQFPLGVSKAIYIPARSVGVIVHKIEIVRCSPDCLILLFRNPGTFESRTLWVDSGPVLDGYIHTAVFNMSDERQLIRMGDSISMLISV